MATKGQEIASWYQSPGPSGHGFAVYASTGRVTGELWSNIDGVYLDCLKAPENPGNPEYRYDMDTLVEELAKMGYDVPELQFK